jgi:hypothetical protein
MERPRRSSRRSPRMVRLRVSRRSKGSARRLDSHKDSVLRPVSNLRQGLVLLRVVAVRRRDSVRLRGSPDSVLLRNRGSVLRRAAIHRASVLPRSNRGSALRRGSKGLVRLLRNRGSVLRLDSRDSALPRNNRDSVLRLDSRASLPRRSKGDSVLRRANRDLVLRRSKVGSVLRRRSKVDSVLRRGSSRRALRRSNKDSARLRSSPVGSARSRSRTSASAIRHRLPIRSRRRGCPVPAQAMCRG